jgi:hypothetical protein
MVYPFGVVSKGERVFYSVDYRKPLREELAALPFFSFKGAFRASMLRRVVEFCGRDDSSVIFSVGSGRPAGRELGLHNESNVSGWEYVGKFKPLVPELLGSSLASRVEEERVHQLVSLGDGSYILWKELNPGEGVR